MLQNSKEEALNNAFKGDDSAGENNIVQELTKEIISEVQRMTGNDVCCDCGAPGDPGPGCPPHFRQKVPGGWVLLRGWGRGVCLRALRTGIV